MNSKNLLFVSARNALATVAYIFAIVWFISRIIESLPDPDQTFLGPAIMLLLFVISAAVTGFLVVGKPAMLYVNGLKQEAFRLFLYTIGWLAILAAIVITSIAIV